MLDARRFRDFQKNCSSNLNGRFREISVLEGALEIKHVRVWRDRKKAPTFPEIPLHDYLRGEEIQEAPRSKSRPYRLAQTRCMYLMVYSHWEGFCKYALQEYLKALNPIPLHIERHHPNLLSRIVLKTSEDLQAPSHNAGHSESFLHWKQISKSLGLLGDEADLPISEKHIKAIVKTDSNLSPDVAADLFNSFDLYTLAERFRQPDVKVNLKKLVQVRNGIAHGDSSPTYRDLRMVQDEYIVEMVDFVRDLMTTVLNELEIKIDDITDDND
ncbi:MAE_28990/MAE_18760 family HEPN-like nuclease [Corynebacterium falsenii]